jgi:hypothetical protein
MALELRWVKVLGGGYISTVKAEYAVLDRTGEAL